MIWLWAFILHAHGSVVDRVVAVVGDQVVLSSDIALDAELAPRDPSPLPFWRSGPPDQRQLEAAVLRVAAGDIALYQPADDAARSRLEALRGRFEDRASWTRFLEKWGLDETSMLAILKRRMVVEAYLARNVQASPSDEDAWNAACAVLLSELLPRIRVRRVPEE